MTLFIIAVSLCILCIIGIILTSRLAKKRNKRFVDTYIGPICVVLLVVDIVFGLIICPTVLEIKTEYVEIKNPVVLISNDAVIIDLTNSSNIPGTIMKLQKFNSYKAVTEYSDSTKYFLERHRSFYNVPMVSYVVWSNPPYKQFYRE